MFFSTPPRLEAFQRLSQLVAQHSQRSRRQAERLIQGGAVTVAGTRILEPFHRVALSDLQNGTIQVDGKPLLLNNNKKRTRVWLIHKQAGEIVTERDPLGRPSVLDRLSSLSKEDHLVAIGRLDVNTEGLLLLTNDGHYARQMELPRNALHRVYKVRVHGLWTWPKQQRIQKGLSIDGVYYPPMHVTPLETSHRRRTSTNFWLQITCTQGKNRQIRKVLQHFGWTVTRLLRVAFGDYRLQTIPPGKVMEVPVKEIGQQTRKGRLEPSKRKRSPRSESTAAPPVTWVRYG